MCRCACVRVVYVGIMTVYFLKKETCDWFCAFRMSRGTCFQVRREYLPQRIWHREGGRNDSAGGEGGVKKILHKASMGTGAMRRVGKQQEVSFKVRPSFPFLPLPPRSGPLNTVNSWSYSCNAAHSKPRGARLLQFASKLTRSL